MDTDGAAESLALLDPLAVDEFAVFLGFDPGIGGHLLMVLGKGREGEGEGEY